MRSYFSCLVSGIDSPCIVLVGFNRPFRFEDLLPSAPPPGSQGAAPSQVDRVSSCDTSRDGQLGSFPAHVAMPCLAIRPGPQRFGLCSGCFLSTARKLDAGGSL